MCGRFSLLSGTGKIEPGYGRLFDESLTERPNIKPSQQVAAIVLRGGEHAAASLRWGLLPFWAKDEKAGYKMINARAESILEKSSYAPLVKSAEHRCLILADGFYEWLKPEDPRQKRTPFRFTFPGERLFAFAGLWTTWMPNGAEPIESCTIITCEPNAEAARVHDRMPVVFPGPDEEAAWLDPSVEGPVAANLLKPLPDGSLIAAPAGDLPG